MPLQKPSSGHGLQWMVRTRLMNPMMRTLLGELTQVRGHSKLVLPTGVKVRDRPSDSELSLWKESGERQTLSR